MRLDCAQLAGEASAHGERQLPTRGTCEASAHQPDERVLRCLCRSRGAVGGFARHIAPATTLRSLIDDPRAYDTWTAHLDAHLLDSLSLLLLLSCLGLGAAALSVYAYRLDRQALWQSTPPMWLLVPERGWTFSALFVHHLKLYHILVRPPRGRLTSPLTSPLISS